MEKDNLHLLHGSGTPSVTKEAVRKMRDDLPAVIEYLSLYAQLTRAKFNALIEQGFTEAQAIELSKTLF